MKDKFYVFLDVHGVLYDVEDNNIGDIYSNEFKFKQESIDALNFLIKNLEENFDVELIITSTFRRKIFRLIKLFELNDLEFDYEKIEAMPGDVGKQTKTEEIKWYLDLKFEDNNYLIIDDSNLENDFDKNKIIKTDYFSGALNQNQVENFLKNMTKAYKAEKHDKTKSCTYNRNFIKLF